MKKSTHVPQSLSQTAGRAGGFPSSLPRLFLDVVLCYIFDRLVDLARFLASIKPFRGGR